VEIKLPLKELVNKNGNLALLTFAIGLYYLKNRFTLYNSLCFVKKIIKCIYLESYEY